MTLDPDFKVTPLFDAECLRNATRQRQARRTSAPLIVSHTSLFWTPAQRSLSEVHYILPMFLFIFLWPPYSPAQVNGGSRNFYTWWTLSVISCYAPIL